jgi:hypothetical protein
VFGALGILPHSWNLEVALGFGCGRLGEAIQGLDGGSQDISVFESVCVFWSLGLFISTHSAIFLLDTIQQFAFQNLKTSLQGVG